MGSNGSTQGDSVDKMPAMNAKPILPIAATSDALVQCSIEQRERRARHAFE